MRIVLIATAVAAATTLNLHIVRVARLRSLYLSAPIFHGPSRGLRLDPERDSRRGINASSAHKHGSTLEECGIRRYEFGRAISNGLSPQSSIAANKVKPGIIGWAQVHGRRGETDTLEKMRRRIECDLYYIDNWSFLLDIKIFVMTMFSRRAYTNAV